MTQYVDLHCHSTASDGTLPPAEVVRLAKDAGLSALALTDHDTAAGTGEAASAAGSASVSMTSSAFSGASYGSSMPVNPLSWPARAFL